VPDESGPGSQRALIERNAIALISNQLSPEDPACEKWLCRHSVRTEICQSGLWNLNHVKKAADAEFLNILEGAIRRMGS
jgi:hypothetical protein